LADYPNDQGNPAGAIPVYIANPEPPNVQSKYINAAATTLVKSGPGTLNSVLLGNNHGISGSQTVTLYDALTATGTPIAVLGVSPTDPPSNIMFGVSFKIGLTVVTSGTNDSTIFFE
jgi:hypothetical protein